MALTATPDASQASSSNYLPNDGVNVKVVLSECSLKFFALGTVFRWQGTLLGCLVKSTSTPLWTHYNLPSPSPFCVFCFQGQLPFVAFLDSTSPCQEWGNIMSWVKRNETKFGVSPCSVTKSSQKRRLTCLEIRSQHRTSVVMYVLKLNTAQYTDTHGVLHVASFLMSAHWIGSARGRESGSSFTQRHWDVHASFPAKLECYFLLPCVLLVLL